MILPKTVTSPRCLPGAVLAALHTLCVVHLLAAEMEGTMNSTGVGPVQGPVPQFPIQEWDGGSPFLTWLCSPSRGRLGSGGGECARLGPEPCSHSKAGQPAAPQSRPVPLGWPHGWARVATPLGSTQPGQSSFGLRASGTGPSSGTGADMD